VTKVWCKITVVHPFLSIASFDVYVEQRTQLSRGKRLSTAEVGLGEEVRHGNCNHFVSLCLAYLLQPVTAHRCALTTAPGTSNNTRLIMATPIAQVQSSP